MAGSRLYGDNDYGPSGGFSPVNFGLNGLQSPPEDHDRGQDLQLFCFRAVDAQRETGRVKQKHVDARF